MPKNDSGLHPVVAEVTARIVERSRETRADYLRRMDAAGTSGVGRAKLSCANWAHAFAGAPVKDKLNAMSGTQPNVGVVTAYNDMLSAHQPFETYPNMIREAARTGMIVLGDGAAGPMLRDASKLALTPHEAVAMLEAADYVELPSGTFNLKKRGTPKSNRPLSRPKPQGGQVPE